MNLGGNIRDHAYRYLDQGAPIDLILTMNVAQTNNGFATGTGTFFGPVLYQGGPDGQVVPVMGRLHHALQVVSSNTTSYSVTVEGTIDGVTWVAVGTAITSDGITQFTGLFKFLHFKITANTVSGSPDPTKQTGVYMQLLSVT